MPSVLDSVIPMAFQRAGCLGEKGKQRSSSGAISIRFVQEGMRWTGTARLPSLTSPKGFRRVFPP